MKKIYSLILFVLFHLVRSDAQVVFQKTFNVPNIYSSVLYTVETPDNGYVICCQKGTNYISESYFLVKIDSLGETQWSKEINNNSSYRPSSIQLCADNGFIVCGNKLQTVNTLRLFLTRLDSVGNVLWSNYFGTINSYGFFAKQTNDGGFIACGQTDSTNRTKSYLIKTDANGNLQWTKVFGDVINFGYSGAYNIEQTSDNGFILCGSVRGNSFCSSDFNGMIMKTDSLGNILWEKTYGFNDRDRFARIYQTNDGGFIIGGAVDTIADCSDLSDMMLMKTDNSGNILWAKTYGGNGHEYILDMRPTIDNGFVLVGNTSGFGFGQSDIYCAKTDSLGNLLWSKTYGGTLSEEVNSIMQTADGGLLIGGSTYSLGAAYGDSYLIKTDLFGNSNCHESNPNSISGNILIPLVNHSYTQGTLDTITNDLLTASPISINIDTLCLSTSINENLIISQFLISPNPSNGEFEITFNKPLNIGVVEMYSSYGTKMFSKEIQNENKLQISIGNAPSGIYIIKVYDSYYYQFKKIVIQN